MFELLFGAIFGTISSLIISHIYFTKSSDEFERSIEMLKIEISELRAVSQNLAYSSEVIANDTSMIGRHAVSGTIDDPEYPYK